MSIKSPDPIDREVGARIRQRRMAMGLSQELLADRLGITFQQVQKYEKGTNRVSASRLVQIARALDVGNGSYFLSNAERPTASLLPHRADALKVARDFDRIAEPHIRAALAAMVHALASDEVSAVTDVAEAA